MASQNDDDDWDKVEIKLETMKLNEPKSILKPPVSIAPRYNPGNSGNTDLQSSYGASSPVIIRPGVQCVAENVPEGALDSALISAMTSSRERMVCLQIENSILNFVKSNDKSMDIPTQFNSFRRLLVYRVGQRFGLNHVQTDSVNEYGERGVTLYKTANTFIPKKLLIDLNIPVNQDDDFDGNTGGSGSGSNQTEPAPAPQKKFMVMKRNPARSDDGAKVVAVKVQQSAEDKERAYQQARARIFGEENAGGASTPGSQVDSTPASGNVSPALPDNNGNSGKGNKSAGGSNSPVNSARNSNSSSPQPLNSNNNSNNSNSNSSNGSSAGIAATNTAAVKRNTSDSALSVQSNGSANGGSGGNNSNNNSNKKKESTNISPAGKTSTTSTSSSPAPGDSAEKAKIDSNTNTANTVSASSASSVGTNAPKKAVVNANNWKENKSQVRNLEAERSDPDFARRNNHNSNNNNGYNGGRGNPSADSVGMSSAAATGVLQYTNNTFYPAAPQQPMYYPPMDANQMNHLVAAQQQFLYQQQQHLQLQQQQQQGMYGGFPPLNFNSAVSPQGAGLQGPGGMQLAPTLPDNPYHPMSTAAGVSPQQQWQPQYNPYYPMPPPSMQPPQQQLGGAAPQYQHQQQFVPPPPPFAPPVQQQASPSATFFDYSHLSTKNQQAQQRSKSGNNNNNHNNSINNNINGNGPSPADYPPLA